LIKGHLLKDGFGFLVFGGTGFQPVQAQDNAFESLSKYFFWSRRLPRARDCQWQ
jgi:hypothetical protein